MSVDYSITGLLTSLLHSVTYPFTHSLTNSCTHSLMCSLMIYSLTHSLTHSQCLLSQSIVAHDQSMMTVFSVDPLTPSTLTWFFSNILPLLFPLFDALSRCSQDAIFSHSAILLSSKVSELFPLQVSHYRCKLLIKSVHGIM